jgi:hypothetical protein
MMDFVVTDHFKKMVDSVLSESLALIEQSAQSLEQSAKPLELEQNTKSFEQTSPSIEQTNGTFEQAIESFEQTSQSFEQTSQSFEQTSQSFKQITESIEKSIESVDTQHINLDQCNSVDDPNEDGIPLDKAQPDDVKLDQTNPVSVNPVTDDSDQVKPDPIVKVHPNGDVLNSGNPVEEKPNLVDPDEAKQEVNIPAENDVKNEEKLLQEKPKSNSEESITQLRDYAITQNGSDRPKLSNGETKTKQLREFHHEKEDQHNPYLGILKAKTFGPTYRKFASPVAIARARFLANELNSSKSL